MNSTTTQPTDAQIATLAAEAALAGDAALVDLCDLAIGAGWPLPTANEQRDALRAVAHVLSDPDAPATSATRRRLGSREPVTGSSICPAKK